MGKIIQNGLILQTWELVGRGGLVILMVELKSHLLMTKGWWLVR